MATTIQDVTNNGAGDGLLKNVYLDNPKKPATRKKKKPHGFATRIYGPRK